MCMCLAAIGRRDHNRSEPKDDSPVVMKFRFDDGGFAVPPADPDTLERYDRSTSEPVDLDTKPKEP